MKTYGNTQSENIFIQLVDEHDLEVMDSEAAALADYCGHADWCIVAVKVDDWNQDLTPWKADAVFGKRGFGDGADATLRSLTEDTIPDIKQLCQKAGKFYLCGYSLAGFFSLWAAYQTDFFAGIVAASPSVWYPDWIKYASDHQIRADRVYLSLGDKESKTRNPVMATVGDAIKTQHQMLSDAGIETCLEWNPGNHFADSDKRVAKGMAWMLKDQS